MFGYYRFRKKVIKVTERETNCGTIRIAEYGPRGKAGIKHKIHDTTRKTYKSGGTFSH
jgi:hypothetical protein